MLCMAAALLASSSTSAEDSGLLPEGPVTLLELLDIALIANSDIALTYDRSRRADGMLAEAKASFWPMVRPYSTIHYGNYPHIIVAQLIDTHEFGNDENLNLPGINTIYEVGAELLIGVYERGQRKLHREMAETAKNLCTADYQVAVNSVAKDVIDGFFRIAIAIAIDFENGGGGAGGNGGEGGTRDPGDSRRGQCPLRGGVGPGLGGCAGRARVP